MYSTSANVIQFLFGFPGVKVGKGISEFNLIKNNYLNGTTGMNSAMCYGIRIMGNNAAGKPMVKIPLQVMSSLMHLLVFRHKEM